MSSISDRDKAYVWHPFTQAKTALPPLVIDRAEGIWLFSEDGKKYMDVNSSWWTTLHGHSNTHIAKKIYEQATSLDHVIFAGATHPKAVELSERIIQFLPGNFQKVFFSDNGSTSVEVAIKMVYQFWFNQGQSRKRFLAIEGAYHGDTFGAMSVGQRGNFNQPFEHLFFEVDFIPFPTSENGNEVLGQLETYFKSGDFAGFIFEPLIQGAAGMRIYDATWLEKAILLAKKYGVLTIADEVMTGFYRTGKPFALNHLDQTPDIICLSKGLTGGVLPLGLTVATQTIYDAFLSDETSRALLHGHSFTGNAIACAAACASLDLLQDASLRTKIEMISAAHHNFIATHGNHSVIESAKSLGTILSITLKTEAGNSYFQAIRDKAYRFFLERGFLIRPLGNVIFVNAPFCISANELTQIYDVILAFADTQKK